MRRVLSVQDISCLGKCSNTVALPLISAMGVETVILPTALLSTHTMFKDFTYLDLKDQMEPITQHWKKENISFDAIYTGYLGTEQVISEAMRIIERFRTGNTLVFVDPAMGDHGRLYTRFDQNYADANARLCAAADVIVPNITEACFMTGLPYREKYGADYVRDLLEALAGLGAKISLLTGVCLEEGKIGVAGYDRGSGTFFEYQTDEVKASFHGTGDIFSSVVIGALMRGLAWQEALKLAADYTAQTIRATLDDPKEPWYGVNFEQTIPWLVRQLEMSSPACSENGVVRWDDADL